MPFFLEKGGANNILEAQRWQYFLRKRGFAEVGRIDGSFGQKTEEATRSFQGQQGIAATGKFDAATLPAARALGYTVVPDNYYDDKRGPGWPPAPTKLKSPGNQDRNKALHCFRFKQLPLSQRSDPDEIVILDSCDGAIADWRKNYIADVAIPQLAFASGYPGSVTCHVAVVPHLQALFARWEALDLLHLLREDEGAFSPRYIRGKSPGVLGHGTLRSDTAEHISNHAFGSAIDINDTDNPYNGPPAEIPFRGCVRELVQPANALGFYWGGHFSSPDGMHFEFADFAGL